MKFDESAQVIVIVAVLLIVVLLLLAVVIEGAVLILERRELTLGADASGKAGLIPVGDHMLTQVVSAQTAAAKFTASPAPLTITPGPSLTETPSPDDLYAWLDEYHLKTLVAPPMRTTVATQSLGYAERNGIGPSNPDVLEFTVVYPYHFHAGRKGLTIYIRIRKEVTMGFASFLGVNEGVLSGETKQSIPHR